jgi:hypothetical protein
MRIIKGIAVIALASVASLLIQSASATTHVNTTSTITAVYNTNTSNALLGILFLTGEDRLTNFNPINETYTEVTYASHYDCRTK